MSYKLFRTEAVIVSYFWGDDEDDNIELAKESLLAEINNRDVVEVSSITEVDEDTYVEDHWVDGIPHGVVDDFRTVGDIVSSGDLQPLDTGKEDYINEVEEYNDEDDAYDLDEDVWREDL